MKRSFTVTCTMEDRWIPIFISFLRKLEYNGKIGKSQMVGFYSDGDGDFRPKFKFSSNEIYDINNKYDEYYHIEYYDVE